MKFNRYLPEETRELLERQYQEYIKITPMTKKEQRALWEWVKDGHSVYENPAEIWADGQIPVEFLTVYREEEYIRKCIKGLDSDAVRAFIAEYYGIALDDIGRETLIPIMELDENLPF